MLKTSSDGLKQTRTAMRKTPRDSARAIDNELEAIAKDVVKDSRRRLSSRKGGGSYQRHPNAISARQGDVEIRQAGTMIGAEFGAARAWVFGRVMQQRQLSKRQFGKPNDEGNIVGPDFNKRGLSRQEKRLEAAGWKSLNRTLDRAGVPRGR